MFIRQVILPRASFWAFWASLSKEQMFSLVLLAHRSLSLAPVVVVALLRLCCQDNSFASPAFLLESHIHKLLGQSRLCRMYPSHPLIIIGEAVRCNGNQVLDIIAQNSAHLRFFWQFSDLLLRNGTTRHCRPELRPEYLANKDNASFPTASIQIVENLHALCTWLIPRYTRPNLE